MKLCGCRLRSHFAGQEETTEETEVLLAVVEDSAGKNMDAENDVLSISFGALLRQRPNHPFYTSVVKQRPQRRGGDDSFLVM